MSRARDHDAGAGALALSLGVVRAALAVAVALATAIGDYSIDVGTVLFAVTNGLGLTAAEIRPIEQNVVWDPRLSCALVAALAGAGLAICGAILQALLRNALAEAFVLGVSAGASTGAVAVIVLGIGPGGLSLGAFAAFGWWRSSPTARPADRTTRFSGASPHRNGSTR